MQVSLIRPNRQFLFGSSAGESDIAPVKDLISAPGRPEVFVGFDFSDAVAVNGSYLRSTLLWMMLCGQADVENETPSNSTQAFAIRPYPLFPLVSGCSEAVKAEIAEFFLPRNLAVLIVPTLDAIENSKALIIGHMEKFLGETLSSLCQLGSATAHQLSQASTEKITINAWSNRLLDLYRLRLVRRQREGKFWIYKPIAKEHEVWA